MEKTVCQKVTMWIKHPDEWDELTIDEIIYNALSEHGIEVVKSLPYEEDESYSDEDSTKDKREWLKNNSKLFESNYDNMILYAESFEIGAKAWVVNKDYIEDEVPEVEKMKVVFALHRKDDEDKYDEFADDDNLMLAYDGDYDVSGEFVLDDDIIYVFLEEA